MKAQKDTEIGLLLSSKLGSMPYVLKWVRERRNLVTHRTERALVGVTTSQPKPSTNYFLVLAIDSWSCLPPILDEGCHPGGV